MCYIFGLYKIAPPKRIGGARCFFAYDAEIIEFLERNRQKCRGYCEDYRREQVGDLNFFAPDEIESDAEDKYRAYKREVAERGFGHQRTDDPGKRGNTALEYCHGNSREDAALAHTSCHHHNDDKVEY